MNELEMNLVDNSPLDLELETTAEIFDYNKAINKPLINNVELKGNKSSSDLGLQPAGEYITEETDPVFSASASAGITSNDITNWNNKSDFSGSYNDLTDKPTIPTNSDFTLNGLGEKSYNNLTDKPSIPSNTSDLTNNSGFITNAVNNLTYYTLKTSTGSLIDLEINSSTYVITLSLKDQDGTIISTDTIDLPLESVVVGGSYDSTNKKIVLTLENGNTVEFSVADLVSGLQTELSSTNKLSADYVDDSNSGNKFVTTSEKSTWNAKYDKPSGGIPSTDLASAVQTSLGKADTAIQATDIATKSKVGLVKGSDYFGLDVSSNGNLYANAYTYYQYRNQKDNNAFVGKGVLENVLNNSIILTGTSAPTTSTVGYRIGQLYIDTTNDKTYQLTAISNGTYTWKQIITANDLTPYELTTNKVISISSSSTDTQYPTAKCVYDMIGDVETILTTLTTGGGV